MLVDYSGEHTMNVHPQTHPISLNPTTTIKKGPITNISKIYKKFINLPIYNQKDTRFNSKLKIQDQYHCQI